MPYQTRMTTGEDRYCPACQEIYYAGASVYVRDRRFYCTVAPCGAELIRMGTPNPDPRPKEAPMAAPTTSTSTPTVTPIQALHADLLAHTGEGIKAGAASELCTLLVDGVVRAFDDVPVLGLVADNRFGRAFLSLAIPYALAILCVVAPGAVPGGEVGAANLRKVCLYAFQGHATFAVAPVMGKLKGTIRNVLSAAVEAQVIPADKAE